MGSEAGESNFQSISEPEIEKEGGEPADFILRFGDRIKHVHWKDMGPEWASRRRSVFGCGMATIPLGDGIIRVRSIVAELERIGLNGDCTLEIAGPENVRKPVDRLKEWSTLS